MNCVTMLAAAIMYILNAYPEQHQSVAEICAVHSEDKVHPKGYELLGEACDYYKDPYLKDTCEIGEGN